MLVSEGAISSDGFASYAKGYGDLEGWGDNEALREGSAMIDPEDICCL